MHHVPAFRRLSCFSLCLQLTAAIARAHTPAEEMAAAANNFLAALSPEQRAKAVYELKDDERLDWHFIPKPRKGLPIKEMIPAQRALAHALLNSALSQRGYAKAATIMSLEQVLFELENKAPHRDAELYYFTIFGTPGKQAWAWRLEGHHISLNFALVDGQILALTPSFLGANPAEVRSGPRKGLRVLGDEEDLGRALVRTLTADQQKIAIITNIAPSEIVTGNARKVDLLEPMGLAAGSLTKAQQELLWKVLQEYVTRYRPELAEAGLQNIRQQGIDKLHFAWAGDLEVGKPHYYRIQGPGFLMEYDNTQNNANHVHTVWRDLKNDFGGDTLRAHYDQVPHAQ